MSYLGRTRTEAVRHYVMIALPMPAPFIGAFRVPVIRHGGTMRRDRKRANSVAENPVFDAIDRL